MHPETAEDLKKWLKRGGVDVGNYEGIIPLQDIPTVIKNLQLANRSRKE